MDGKPVHRVPFSLSEIVNNAAGANFFENLLHKLNMKGVHLVIILRFLVSEDQIQPDLIRLIHNGSMTLHHPSNVDMLNARNRAQILFGSSNQFVRRLRIVRVGPKNHNV